MNTYAELFPTASHHCPFEYVIQVYTEDGRLLSECLVDALKHKIADMDAAAEYAKNKPAIAKFGSTIIVVSSEFANSLDQVHLKMTADYPE